MNQFKKTTQKSEKRRGIYFQLGLIIAGGLTLMAFEWTSPVHLSDLPPSYETDEVEIDFPEIMPEVKIDKPEVKHIEAPKISELFEVVEKLIEPVVEPSPEPTPEPVFDPTTWEPKEPFVDPNPAPIMVAEIMPEFKGGLKNLFKFLSDNIEYPEREKRIGLQGTVHLTFVVGKKGEIKKIEVLRGVNEAIDAEAIRVLKAMPNWKPGKQHGEAVNVRYNLPIKFKLS